MLDRFNEAKNFSKLGFGSGYHQIGVEEESIEKTAFRTNKGHWELIVIPFGLCNSLAMLQKLMNQIFADELNSFLLVYLDEILIFSRSVEEHWE